MFWLAYFHFLSLEVDILLLCDTNGTQLIQVTGGSLLCCWYSALGCDLDVSCSLTQGSFLFRMNFKNHLNKLNIWTLRRKERTKEESIVISNLNCMGFTD